MASNKQLPLKPRSDWQVSGASFLAPEKLCKKTCASYTFTTSHYASFLFKKVVIGFAKMRSPLCSRSSNQRRSFTTETWEHRMFWRQFLVPEKWRQKPRSHRQVFWRKKLATETCQSEHGFTARQREWLTDWVNKLKLKTKRTDPPHERTAVASFSESLSLVFVELVGRLEERNFKQVFIQLQHMTIHCSVKCWAYPEQ